MENRIKEIMSEKGILLKDMAASLGISSVALSKILNGDTALSVNRAQQFANVMDVEFWQLFYTREEMLNSINNDNAGNTVCCPYCGKELLLSIK